MNSSTQQRSLSGNCHGSWNGFTYRQQAHRARSPLMLLYKTSRFHKNI
ncbi:MAG: hypothetical protein RMX96_31970 [Nostoc sp. ChiSLP02]|nr:hypothetical protein [Nostoc sp. DedSLP05]MDZ8103151.1 hypothetical protein [Nostoc sp. DedSLP01]MDZ8189442.1 hypothetical protein [Nostoc sp. ChiSLP02]